jgi:hypothetical protein
MKILSCFALITCFRACVAPPRSKRPNILLIMSDDMGFSDIGVTAAKSRHRISIRLRKTVFAAHSFTTWRAVAQRAHHCSQGSIRIKRALGT